MSLEIDQITTSASARLSGPLHELANHAPYTDDTYSILDTSYAISNDNLAGTFAALSRREDAPTFASQTNRTALLVGESALMASIRFMPEDTIVMLDHSPAMVTHMRRYVAALRTSTTVDEWYESMCENVPIKFHSRLKSGIQDLYGEQAGNWLRAGHEHPVLSPDAFGQASELARKKAIIPWRADLTNLKEMGRLGKLLRAYKASVTMLNMTNVLVCEERVENTRELGENLGRLPISPGTPVVNTTEADFDNYGHMMLPVTHPAKIFYGLDDFRDNGGDTNPYSINPGAAITRAVHS